ncbi:hypothetical protein FSP39_013657 [Pinctada imbricata]|uniref:Uncharacterized protein n=1 Tax=Pinctada imbricata TaxID=66713 RepID=A0AA88XWQ1_PINIB|nr:hypothetical protein FSP39_013657 [Pinctada imbricata]
MASRRNFSTSKQLRDFEQTEAIKYYVPKTGYYQNYIMKMQEFGSVAGRSEHTHLITTKKRLKTAAAHLFGVGLFIFSLPDRGDYYQWAEFFKKREE